MGVKSLNTFRATLELKNEHNRTIHSVHPFNHSVFKSLAGTTLSRVFSYLRMPPVLTPEGSGHLLAPVAQWVSIFALEHLMYKKGLFYKCYTSHVPGLHCNANECKIIY